MKETLEELFSGLPLSPEKAKELFRSLLQAEANPFQVAAALSCYRMRSPSVEELLAFREVALDHCPKLDFSEFQAIDVCGTGGDGKNTFNISTAAAFVIAACGVKVVKHGGGAVSSKVGSSNLLEGAGIKFTTDSEMLKRQLEGAGICFLHAPLFHSSFKNIAPVRKQLGIKTVFNMLGPLLNPAQPDTQIIGVYNLGLVKFYRFIAQRLGKNFAIVHTLDGCDEVSLTAETLVANPACERIFKPSDFGFGTIKYEQIGAGKDLDGSVKILKEILNNSSSPEYKSVVAANAGLAIYRARKGQTPLIDCVSEAQEAVESKRALKVFNKLLELN